MPRRKSLLIGINYTGSEHELRGCHSDVQNVAQFLYSRGYSSDPRDQVIMTDDRQGPFYPDGHNMLAAMDWLVSEPGCACFLHYSGHGGTVRAPDRESGFDDTIVPADFERNGQINSDTLHRHLVSRLSPNSTLFVLFDCCHSGSALELPFVYRTDDDGNLNMMDNLKAGLQLIGEANEILRGGLRFDARGLSEARSLYGDATNFFKGLQHMGGGGGEEGIAAGEEGLEEEWGQERKVVTMFSGCRDDQTSADANIMGLSQGAMSWAFLETMRDMPGADYVAVLQDTRARLKQSQYQQVPQLSVGYEDFQLEQPLVL